MSVQGNLVVNQLPNPNPKAFFDAQSREFDRRAGLPEDCSQQVATAILKMANLAPEELLVEVGAGTGQIGALLAQSHAQYLGFDVSEGMLEIFQERIQDNPAGNWAVVQADGNQVWPVADGSTRAIFSSRAMHLLDKDRVLNEVFRVAHPEGATLLIGRVHRDQQSSKAQMQRQLQAILSQHGYNGRSGKKTKRQLLDCCIEQGAIAVDPVTAVQWSVVHAPMKSLTNWRSKAGLGGIETLAGSAKEAILQELEVWAIATFGDLEKAIETEESYVIEGVRLPTKLA